MDESSNTFVISWDQLGLEAIVNVSEIEKEEVWEALTATEENLRQGRPSKISHIVSSMMLRAKFNSHRHYEIYAIDVSGEIGEQDLRDLFEQDPQTAADLVRSRGRQLYSDRVRTNQIKII